MKAEDFCGMLLQEVLVFSMHVSNGNQFVSPQIQNTVNGVQSVGLIGIGDIFVDNHTFRSFSLISWNIFMENLRNEQNFSNGR